MKSNYWSVNYNNTQCIGPYLLHFRILDFNAPVYQLCHAIFRFSHCLHYHHLNSFRLQPSHFFLLFHRKISTFINACIQICITHTPPYPNKIKRFTFLTAFSLQILEWNYKNIYNYYCTSSNQFFLMVGSWTANG